MNCNKSTNSYNKTLHIIANDYFLTKFLLESISDDDSIRVIIHKQVEKKFRNSILKLLASKLPRLIKYYPSSYINTLKSIPKEDDVLIFSIENAKELKIISSHLKSKKISIFFWNPVSSFSGNKKKKLEQIKKLGKVFTFDPEDARIHQLELVNQVYRNINEVKNDKYQENSWDIYFVGQDKGRIDVIKNLHDLFKNLEFKTKFIIVGSKTKNTHKENLKFSEKSINYIENLRYIMHSKCLLEVTQKNQAGLTIRALEAAFLGKKLITNNTSILHTNLYHPTRIFILDKDNINDIKYFIESPLEILSKEQLAPYEFSNWCNQFRSN